MTDITKYKDNLLEIKKRTEIIVRHLNGVGDTKFLITEVEFLSLQFRKVLELIALSSLIANKEIYSKHHDKFAKHYNARLIFQDLQRVNPSFYPIPTKQKNKVYEGQRIVELENVKDGFLTKDEFLLLYEKCGGMLHAENPYGNKKNYQSFYDEFPNWLSKIVKLLSHHNILLVDGKTMIVGLMHEEKDGQPYVYEFGVVKKI